MTNDCKTCPVSTGTHKPAEALHKIAEPDAQHLQELAAYRFTVENLQARVAELEARLEIDHRHPYDGIAARDATIKAQDERIAELESQLEAIGAGGVEPLRKGFVRLTDVLARLEQGFGANSAPVTTIKRHFEMQAAPAHPAEGVPDERAAFESWLGIKPCGAAHDFGWAAWKARAALAATQPAAQGMEADLADEQIDETFNQMPDGAAGFLKSWGYRQFARAVLAAQAKQGGF